MYKKHFFLFSNYVGVKYIKQSLKFNGEGTAVVPGINWCDQVYANRNLSKIIDGNLDRSFQNKKIPFAFNEAIFADSTELKNDLVLFFSYEEGWNQKADKEDLITFLDQEIAYLVFYDGTIRICWREDDVKDLNWGEK
ncbi:MAG: hypothetical protein ACIAQZ_02770 [Sedimentisphaeraceae bacterium JB056]